MTTTATRLYGPAALPGADTSLFTVPAGKVALVRDLRVVNRNAAATVSVAFGVGGTGAGQQVQTSGAIVAGATFTSVVWLVLAAGESLNGIRLAGAGPADTTVDGYLLDA